MVQTKKDKKIFKLSTRNKFILTGLISTTALVVGAGILTIFEIQNKFDNAYNDYAKTISKTLAANSPEISNVFDNNENTETFKNYLNSILNAGDDISLIEYRDKENRVINLTKNNVRLDENNLKLSVSSPVFERNDNSGNITGSVTIGLNGQSINKISHSAYNSLFLIFFLTWASFSLVLIANAVIVGREIKLFQDGVKQISTGQFGVKLNPEDSGGQIQNLTDAFNDMSNILYHYDEQNYEQILLERNKLEAVLMSIINGVIVCDNTDTVVLTNNAALKILGIDNSEIVSTKIQEYTDINDIQCFKEKIEEYKDTPIDTSEKKPLEFNLELNSRTMKAMISPMFSNNQDYLGYIIVLIDITREAEVNKLKNVFISNVSHELRTPVTVLRSYIDTLCNEADELDEETKKEFIQTANTEVQRLQAMVNDILDFSRLESPNIKLPKDLNDIIPIVERVISSMKILADEKKIEISLSVQENLPQIPLHTESIERAIKNLVSNALKYSPDEKDINIAVKMSDNPDFLEIDIQDHGIGIAQKDIDKIFERFYRVENKVHSVKGTGIGLHLVKTTIETHHKGHIYVQSKLGEGSTFSILLPLKQDEDDLV